MFVHRAADWKLDTPDWSGRLRITAKGQVAYIKLEDKVSGMFSSRINPPTMTVTLTVINRDGWMDHFPSCPAGELFAQAPIKEYPGVAVETVSDSSRYFVLRIQDDNGEVYDHDYESV